MPGTKTYSVQYCFCSRNETKPQHYMPKAASDYSKYGIFECLNKIMCSVLMSHFLLMTFRDWKAARVSIFTLN